MSRSPATRISDAPPFASGRAFRMRHAAMMSSVGVPAAVLTILYLALILRMTPEQWWAFVEGVTVIMVVLSIAIPLLQRNEREIGKAIDRDLAGALEREGLEEAYGRLGRLPLGAVVQEILTYLVAGGSVSIWMALRLESVSLITLAVVFLAASSAGVVVAVFLHFVAKRFILPLHHAWSLRIPDPARRQELIPTVQLVRKLAIPLSAVSMVTLLFASLLSYMSSMRPVEKQDLRVKHAYGAYVVQQLAEDPKRIDELRETGVAFAALSDLLILERATGAILDGSPEALEANELVWLLDMDLATGDSAEFDSPNSFAWAPLDEAGEKLLVMTTPGSVFTAEQIISRLALLGLMGSALLVTLLTCWLLARDVGVTTQGLTRKARRIAEGDLTDADRVVESDDELGELARTFEVMLVSLRSMIGQVAAAADGLEGAAGDLGGVGEAVERATNEQRTSIEQATGQVAAVNRKVSEITESAQALNANVEEAGSSVLELGAASEELNHTATTLSQHVEEVTSSIDQMIRSVDQVGGHTEGLAHAVSETVSSMSEMAAAMTDVDGNASETARLSAQVVKLSESGQERVHETISGMDAIREATESADTVIRSLAGRVTEIGAIVDVIDDVADETNLLALNAAIIAAQAGDQGKSFSVVADEIKDLADRVLSSTKEIGDLIRSVQDESANATDAIGHGFNRVQRGVELAAEAGLALEEITQASRDSGGRIDEIVNAVREQSSAATHVAGLMEQVHAQVEEIRSAAREQEQGNQVIQRSAQVTLDVAQQTQRTTEEQSRGAARIRNSMESIRDAVDQIHAGLKEQTESCRATVSFLEEVFERTSSNEESAQRLGTATRDLTRQAGALRGDVQRFRIQRSAGDSR